MINFTEGNEAIVALSTKILIYTMNNVVIFLLKHLQKKNVNIRIRRYVGANINAFTFEKKKRICGNWQGRNFFVLTCRLALVVFCFFFYWRRNECKDRTPDWVIRKDESARPY